MKIITLQPPSPPYMNVKRDYAGGMGVADPSVRPDYGHDRGYITLPYMSLLYVTAILEKAGHDVRFLDAQADGLGIEALIAVLREAAPDVIVSVINLPSIYGDLHVLREIKERVPGRGGVGAADCDSAEAASKLPPEGGTLTTLAGVPPSGGSLARLQPAPRDSGDDTDRHCTDVRTVAIGTVCRPLFDEIAAAGAADVVVRGDPEAVIMDLLREQPWNERSGTDSESRFEQQNGTWTNREPAHILDLDALPDLPYHLVPLEKYWYHGFGPEARFAAVFASRGCSFQCYYCPYPMGFGGCIVYRDPIKVVDEVERLQKRYGVEGILFRDQVFTMDWARTNRLCDEIIRRGLTLRWVVETRLDRVNEELLRKMKAAGCVRIHYGLESGDPALFSRVGKDGVEARMERLIQNFSLTERVGIHPHMFMLVGLLGENRKTIQSTIEVVRRIKPITLQVAVVTPYPGTGLYDEIKKKGLLLTGDWSQYTGFKAVARTEALSSEELLEARRNIMAAHRNAVFWKKQGRKARLLFSYLADGSLARRLMRHARRFTVKGIDRAARLGKRGACELMYRSGAMRLYRDRHAARSGHAVCILSSHRVIDTRRELAETDAADLQRGCLSLPEFEAALDHLQRHYTFMRLGDFVACFGTSDGEPASSAAKAALRLPPPPSRLLPNAVVLTFDDAFKDVIQTAYPLLRERGIPFTIFLTTGYVSRNERMLSEDDVRELAAEPLVSWGAHGVTHRWLTNMPAADAEREIRESKAAVERLTGRPVSLFCYPDGKYDDSTLELLRRHGFVAACATERGVNTTEADPYALKRIPFESEPLSRFAMRVAGMV